MKDLFDREQDILDQALGYLATVSGQESCDRKLYEKLVKEYERILKLLKRVTWVSDRTADELNADKTKLLDKVNLDGLTGIYNRQYFNEEMVNVLKHCSEIGEPLGVLMLDVDFFKLFNDTYGHLAGDDCLRKIAQILEGSVPDGAGFAARYGGEEFVIVLPNAGEAEIKNTAETVLHRLKALKIPHEKNAAKGCVTISIGGSMVEKVIQAKMKAYIDCADAALYRSKQAGRDRFTLERIKED